MTEKSSKNKLNSLVNDLENERKTIHNLIGIYLSSYEIVLMIKILLEKKYLNYVINYVISLKYSNQLPYDLEFSILDYLLENKDKYKDTVFSFYINSLYEKKNDNDINDFIFYLNYLKIKYNEIDIHNFFNGSSALNTKKLDKIKNKFTNNLYPVLVNHFIGKLSIPKRN
jgi:hypothetical protein